MPLQVIENNLVPVGFDYIQINWSGNAVSSLQYYKSGPMGTGANGELVATLTFSYSGNQVVSIQRI